MATHPALMIEVVDDVIQHVVLNQAAELALINNQHASRKPPVFITPFVSFFDFEEAQGYKAPALFVLGMDGTTNPERLQQSTDVTWDVHLIAVAEGRDAQEVTRACYLYAALLVSLLDMVTFKSDTHSGLFKMIWRSVSPTPMLYRDDSGKRVFRRDISLMFEAMQQEAREVL